MWPVGSRVHKPRAEASLPLTTYFLTRGQSPTLTSARAMDATAGAAGSRAPGRLAQCTAGTSWGWWWQQVAKEPQSASRGGGGTAERQRALSRVGPALTHYRHLASARPCLEPGAGSGLQWGQEGGGFEETKSLQVSDCCELGPSTEGRAAGPQVWGPGLVRALPRWGPQDRGAVGQKGPLWSVFWGGEKGGNVEGLGDVHKREGREKSRRTEVGPEKRAVLAPTFRVPSEPMGTAGGEGRWPGGLGPGGPREAAVSPLWEGEAGRETGDFGNGLLPSLDTFPNQSTKVKRPAGRTGLRVRAELIMGPGWVLFHLRAWVSGPRHACAGHTVPAPHLGLPCSSHPAG